VDKIIIKIEGAKEMEQALLALGTRIAGNIGNNALRAGAKPIVAEAKRLAPRSKKGRRGRIAPKVRAQLVSSGISTMLEIRIGVGRPWGSIAHLLEFGHVSKNQFGGPYGFVAPVPFLRPAMDTRRAQALNEIGRVLAKGINDNVNALRAKGKIL
jgi:HK97 gp10 family phage protein